MNDEIQRSLSPEEAAAGRERYLREHVIPHVQRAFTDHPDLRSAMLLVAQYWCDEAEDAVHEEVVFSVLERPDLEAARACGWSEIDEINTPGRCSSSLSDDLPSYVGGWDDNGKAIPLFAAFCQEDCHQEMDHLEAYTPYAVLRRGDDGITVEIVGTMLRPWLDGITPQWWTEAG